MKIRVATAADAPRLSELWTMAGLAFDPGRVEWDLTATSHPDLMLVAEDEECSPVGTVLGTFDGWRGWVHRLAVHPERRGQGIAAALMAELERRLAAKGCPKINLLVEPANAGVVSLYSKLGYQVDELIFMEKFVST